VGRRYRHREWRGWSETGGLLGPWQLAIWRLEHLCDGISGLIEQHTERAGEPDVRAGHSASTSESVAANIASPESAVAASTALTSPESLAASAAAVTAAVPSILTR
jgi:hypothetical protein